MALRQASSMLRCAATRGSSSSSAAVRQNMRAFAAPAGGEATRTIQEGDTLPDATLRYFDQNGDAQEVTSKSLTSGKKVVFFAVPGAFTPTCSNQHLPGFREKAEELKAKGVDTIACVSVNDSFVMREWKNAQGIGDDILMLADGAAEFTKAIGAQMDASDKGLGIRSRRYAMLVDNGVVKKLNLEQGGELESSSAENMLAALE